MRIELSCAVDDAGKYMVSVRREDGGPQWETVRFATREQALNHIRAIADCMWRD